MDQMLTPIKSFLYVPNQQNENLLYSNYPWVINLATYSHQQNQELFLAEAKCEELKANFSWFEMKAENEMDALSKIENKITNYIVEINEIDLEKDVEKFLKELSDGTITLDLDDY